MTLYEDAYEEYMRLSKDPAWAAAFEIALGEWMQDIAVYHQGPVQAIVDQASMKKINNERDNFTKAFLLNRVAEIRKARSWDESKVHRNADGEFASVGNAGAASSGHNTGPGARHIRDEALTAHATRLSTPGMTDSGDTPMDGPTRRGMGLGPGPDRQGGFMSDVVGRMSAPVDMGESEADDKAEALRVAAEMTYALAARTGDPKDKQRVQYTIVDGLGQSRIEVPQPGVMPKVDWDGGERIRVMAPVGPDNPVHVAGQVMNVGLIAGRDSRESAKYGAIAADIQDSLNTTDWGRRLQNTANTVAIVTNDDPRAVKAHAVAQMVNVLGPDAARAFGPKMRQLSYRYTGQEADGLEMSDVARMGKSDSETIEQYEARLVEDLKQDLPTEMEYKSSLQAGSTPPSKGYIVNKNGKVTSEAVGFSDDWYAPFNLSKLPSMKNGSYVRTRGYGGLTPEDIRLAMHTGAKRVTIVSNTGNYTVEFSPRALSAGHRFGFGGAAMIRRYTKSLDAIANGKVDNPDSRDQKLRLDHRGYQAALSDLKVKYPYFIKSVEFTRAGEQNYPQGKSPNDQQADEQGYVRPLALRARGAQTGYGTDKQAYDQLEQYRLRQSTLLGLKNDAAFRSKAEPKSNSNSSGRSPWNTPRAEAQATGQGRLQSSATSNPADRLTAAEADQVLDQFRKVFLTGPDIELDSDNLSTLREALLSDDPADRGAKQSWRDRFAHNLQLRQELLDELSSAYGEDPKAKRLFGGLDVSGNGGRNDESDDEGVDEASGFYDKHTLIPNAKIDNSPRLREYMNALEGKNDTEGLAAMKWYREQMARFNGSEDGFELLDDMRPENQKRFMALHTIVTRVLNDELEEQDEAKKNPGLARAEAKVSDREVATPGGERKVVSLNPRAIFDADTPEEAAYDLFFQIDEANETHEEKTRAIENTKSNLLRARDAFNARGQDVQAQRLVDTYDALEEIQNNNGMNS